jgi:uncharacterized membrane protein
VVALALSSVGFLVTLLNTHAPMSDAASPPPRRTVRGHLRAYFLTGVVVAAPLLITAYVVSLIIDSIDGLIKPMLPPAMTSIAIPGLGVVIAILALTLLGAVTANLAGRFVLDWADRLLFRIPLVKTIYKPVKQVFDGLMRPGAKTFRDVVLIEYPRAGSHVLAFRTGPAPQAASDAAGQLLSCVFVPTSPNLYAGFLLMLPADAMRPVAMTVEEAIRTVVSAGIATQPDRKSPAALSRSNK